MRRWAKRSRKRLGKRRAAWYVAPPRVCPHPTVPARLAQHAVTTQQVVAHERGDAILSLASCLQNLRFRFGRRLPGEIVDF